MVGYMALESIIYVTIGSSLPYMYITLNILISKKNYSITTINRHLIHDMHMQSYIAIHIVHQERMQWSRLSESIVYYSVLCGLHW